MRLSPNLTMRVTSGRTALEVDEATGSVVLVADRDGHVHFDARGEPERLGRLFRIFSPLPDWVAHHVDNASCRPRIEGRRDGGIVLRFVDLRSERGPAPLEVEVVIEPAPDDEVRLTIAITNRGRGDVTDVLFPWLASWQPGREATDELVLGGTRRVDPTSYPIPDRDGVGRWNQRDFWTYPRDLYCPWVDISTGAAGQSSNGNSGGGAAHGVGIISYQRQATVLGAFVENLAGYDPGLELSLGLSHFPRIMPGARWQSPPIAVVAHEGDWRSIADRYTTWVDTWFDPPPTPDWARRAIGLQNVLFRVQDGTRFHRFDEIPELARTGMQYGVPHLTVWDLGLMGPVPDFMTPWVPLHDADRDAIRTAVAQARALGAHVSVVQNYRILWPGSDFYRNVGARELALRYDGTPYVEEFLPSQWHAAFEAAHIGTMTHVLDPRVPGYRERVLADVEAKLSLGFDSLHWDQPHMHWPSYREDVPGSPDAHAPTVDLLRDVRSLVRRLDPEGIMLGEWGDAFGSQAIDLWFPSWLKETYDLERAVYSVPQALWSCVIDRDPALATRAFGFGAQLFLITRGLLGTLGDVPDFGEHVHALASLKDRCADRLVRARVQHPSVLEVTTDGPGSATAFSSPSGPAIVVVSPGEGGHIRVEIDPEVLSLRRSDQGRGSTARVVHRMNASATEVSGDAIDIELGANEAAVWYV
jgi:hypothetical protein